MLDLTHADWRLNQYGGSERKRTLWHEGRIYMVKFPEPPRAKRHVISYINNQYSEYIGCHIFQLAGLPVQKTFLAKVYSEHADKMRVVVACEDFCQDGSRLIEFHKAGIHDTGSDTPFSTSIEDVYDIVKRLPESVSRRETIQRFWEMFVVDGYIGNPDRHLDNWGFLESPDGQIRLAPVYDCGSSLSPLSSDEEKEIRLRDLSAFKEEEYNIRSVYRMKGEFVYYHTIFKQPPQDLKAAIKSIVPVLMSNQTQIHDLIDDTEGLSKISKQYMKKSLDFRYENILLPAHRKILREQERSHPSGRMR